MSLLKKNQKRQKRRSFRIRAKIRLKNDNTKIRVTVFRSLSHTYGQAIDDSKGNTVASSSTKSFKESGDKKQGAFIAGENLGKRLLEMGLNQVVFDRGHYLYHGRVKSFAEGLRKSGLRV